MVESERMASAPRMRVRIFKRTVEIESYVDWDWDANDDVSPNYFCGIESTTRCGIPMWYRPIVCPV